MIYALSILFAALLVFAQSSWKIGVELTKSSSGGTGFRQIFTTLISVNFVLGAFIYVLATLLYLYLVSRYQFSTVQTLAIPLSLIFSIIVAGVVFNEHITNWTIMGIIVIAVGIITAVMGMK